MKDIRKLHSLSQSNPSLCLPSLLLMTECLPLSTVAVVANCCNREERRERDIYYLNIFSKIIIKTLN
jgi:hypothetical protein